MKNFTYVTKTKNGKRIETGKIKVRRVYDDKSGSFNTRMVTVDNIILPIEIGDDNDLFMFLANYVKDYILRNSKNNDVVNVAIYPKDWKVSISDVTKLLNIRAEYKTAKSGDVKLYNAQILIKNILNTLYSKRSGLKLSPVELKIKNEYLFKEPSITDRKKNYGCIMEYKEVKDMHNKIGVMGVSSENVENVIENILVRSCIQIYKGISFYNSLLIDNDGNELYWVNYRIKGCNHSYYQLIPRPKENELEAELIKRHEKIIRVNESKISKNLSEIVYTLLVSDNDMWFVEKGKVTNEYLGILKKEVDELSLHLSLIHI